MGNYLWTLDSAWYAQIDIKTSTMTLSAVLKREEFSSINAMKVDALEKDQVTMVEVMYNW